ncbi:MAG: hypothetical protein JWL61_4715 [Gemmatimonadetes bacterium]|nr:hypothetical protein [Gemmatimonadota bacterium]
MISIQSIRLRAALAAASGAIAITFAVACSDSSAPVTTERTIEGAALALGQGTARTWVTLSAEGAPTALGIKLSETALSGLPSTPMPNMPSAVMLILPLPAEAKITGFDHVAVDWNPNGHDPVQIYGVPHFDFHFYTVSDSAQRAILPSDPQWGAKAASFPAAAFVPPGYVPPPGVPAASTIPMMGLHWTDLASPELNGKPFTSTFIFGSYDGRFIFIEPMITKAYLETHPNATVAVPQPSRWAKPGYYPLNYTVAYDATAKEYRIVLASLTKRE